MKRTCQTILGALCTLAACAALAQGGAPPAPPAFDLQGHRGARGLMPENTLPAFQKGLALGVNTLECDMAITRDGVVVIHHDLWLNPDTTRGPDGQWLDKRGPAISELSYAELQRYDVGRLKPGPVTRGFRLGQLASGGLLALAHGTNDAQKTMGVITLALVANGNIGANADVPTWVVVSAASAIALGTYSGGWRIIRTMGSRIIKMDAAQGFEAQTGGAATILAASHFGYPLSTTHTISGAVMGAGAAKRLSAVRWGVAGNIAAAWVLTLPMAAAIGALTYGVTRIFGTGALGPVVIVSAIAVGSAVLLTRRFQRGAAMAEA